MHPLYILDWAIIAISIFNTVILIWLGLTVLLGGLCMLKPVLAAGIGVTAAILLAARTPLHGFVRQTLTTDELRDALIFAGATRMKTEVLSTSVFLEMNVGNVSAAVAVSMIMVAAAVVVLILMRMWGTPSGASDFTLH